MGPNGSGKSTIIDLLKAHWFPTRLIQVGDKVLVDLDDHGNGRFVPPHERRNGLLAQNALLFPHMSVLENVAFAPRSSGQDAKAAAAVAHQFFDLADCSQFAGRKAS